MSYMSREWICFISIAEKFHKQLKVLDKQL